MEPECLECCAGPRYNLRYADNDETLLVVPQTALKWNGLQDQVVEFDKDRPYSAIGNIRYLYKNQVGPCPCEDPDHDHNHERREEKSACDCRREGCVTNIGSLNDPRAKNKHANECVTNIGTPNFVDRVSRDCVTNIGHLRRPQRAPGSDCVTNIGSLNWAPGGSAHRSERVKRRKKGTTFGGCNAR